MENRGLRDRIADAAADRAYQDRRNPMCAWRGRFTGEERECQECQGRTRLKVFECGRGAHGGTVTADKCVSCQDRFVHSHRPFTSLDIALSTRCNLRCPFCYLGHGGKQEKPNLAFTMHCVKWFLGQCSSVPPDKKRLINIYGGEPLLEWDTLVRFVEETHKIARCALSFSVVTNGTLLSEERLEWMLRNKIRPQFSIDGCPTVQDAQRLTPTGKGTSDRIAQVLRLVSRKMPGTTIRATVTPDAVPHLLETVKYFHEAFGFRKIMAVHASGYPWTPDDLERYRTALFEVADYMISLAQRKDPIFLTLYPFERGCRGFLESAVTGGHQGCGAGRSMVAVDMAGNLWPCHRFCGGEWDSPWRLGSVFSGVTNRMFKNLVEITDCRDTARPECKLCNAQLACVGHCMWESMERDGANASRYPFPQGRLPHVCTMQQIQTAAWQYLHKTLLRRGITHYAKGSTPQQYKRENLGLQEPPVATITRLETPPIDGASGR